MGGIVVHVGLCAGERLVFRVPLFKVQVHVCYGWSRNFGISVFPRACFD